MPTRDPTASSPRALVFGGTGPVGRAVAQGLLADGWRVDVTGRDPARMPPSLAAAGARFLASDRTNDREVGDAVGPGADLVVDCLAYTGAHAAMLLPLLADVGHTVMVSAKAVYVDALGNHVNSSVPPDFRVPVTEDQPTLPPGDMDYDSREGYGPNKVAAERTFLDSGHPVSVLRASKVRGPGAERPREWVFVRRALDRRPALFLRGLGLQREHCTSAVNLAGLVRFIADRPAPRILNVADPDRPSAVELSRVVASHLGHVWDEVLLPEGTGGGLGRHPWEAALAMELDTSAARKLGYRPVAGCASTLPGDIDWMVARASAAGTAAAFDADYFRPYFDYAAEDAYLGGAHGAGRVARGHPAP